ncbi:MAG TPA: UDP-N-acetylmuramoyl-tripeptide--D-alanyl-D-alanine ligase [Armatimonadetes bacterium]|nr:UDP-N-acetylmuramoyl-tripeptide--D-alanyl-D-alanine ligase [Armatimonadota bacterium]
MGTVFTAAEVHAALAPQRFEGSLQVGFRGVSTDSRTVRPGDLFFALHGERFNGHDFVTQALAGGAAGAVVSEARDYPCQAGQALFYVADTRQALGGLARWYRQRFAVPVVAVTGSCGKTTTKELIAHVLRTERTVLSSESSYNNEIGVPLTLFRLRPEHEIVVLEIAMRGRGQIAYLARLARPQVGVLTNIGVTHFELLESVAAIAEAKAELLTALPPDGQAVLNVDDEQVRSLADRSPAPVVWYGRSKGAEVRAEEVQTKGLAGSTFTLVTAAGTGRVHLHLPGGHQVSNALAAAAVGTVMGISLSNICRGLEAARPLPLRLHSSRTATGVLLINDAYNAAPASMRGALEVLCDTPTEGRRIAILGDMRELGTLSESAHLDLGRWAAGLGLDYLVTVGELGRLIAAGAREAGQPPETMVSFPDAPTALPFVQQLVRPGDTVLLKASRALALETIAEGLLSEQ